MGARSRRSSRGPRADGDPPPPDVTTGRGDQPSALKTAVAIPLALIVFVATAAIMAAGFMLWDAIVATPWSSLSGFVAAATGAAAGVFTSRATVDQFVAGYSGKIVFLGFVLAIAAASAFGPVREFGRDHWFGTSCLILVVMPLVFLVFWRRISLD